MTRGQERAIVRVAQGSALAFTAYLTWLSWVTPQGFIRFVAAVVLNRPDLWVSP